METKTAKVNKKTCIFIKRFGINMVLVEGFSCFISQQQFRQ